MFAVERFLRFLVLGVAAYGVWRFSYDRAGIQQAYNNDLPACTGTLGSTSATPSCSG